MAIPDSDALFLFACQQCGTLCLCALHHERFSNELVATKRQVAAVHETDNKLNSALTGLRITSYFLFLQPKQIMIPRTYLTFLGLLAVHAAAERARVGHAEAGCNDAEAAVGGDTCAIFANAWLISEEVLKALNPGIDCSQPLVEGKTYCIESDKPTSPTGKSTTLTTTPPVKTTAAPTKTTQPSKPSHTSAMPGVATDCKSTSCQVK
jgi:hypothetical protein